ncbi:hypothetical protein ACFY1P_09385 [Streptomyces sp. NPDC001407]|uniref:hypothetical protein n=1 Tax=Streptomyces sp. NPDC001407 TaxID=3364573 RepID=UPI0036B418F8
MPIYVRHPDNLRTVAREIRDLTTGLDVPEHSTAEMVAYTAGARLKALGRMAEEMSDLLLYRLTGPLSTDRAELRGNTALATATSGCVQAMSSLSEILRQVAFLNEHARLPPSPDLADARDAAWSVIHDHVEEARTALHDTADQLNSDARRLVQPPRRPAASTPQAQCPPAPAPLSTAVRRRPAL